MVATPDTTAPAASQPASSVGVMEKLGLQFGLAMVMKGFQALAAKYPGNHKVQDFCNNGIRFANDIMVDLAGM